MAHKTRGRSRAFCPSEASWYSAVRSKLGWGRRKDLIKIDWEVPLEFKFCEMLGGLQRYSERANATEDNL